MSGEAFDYAIRKDIRNNPIVREVDAERHREMWRSMSVGGFLVVALLFSAWQHFSLQQSGYRQEALLRQRAEEEVVNRHLKLEVETLMAPARIERVATRRLRMVAPAAGDATVIERITPPAAPPRSVVALR